MLHSFTQPVHSQIMSLLQKTINEIGAFALFLQFLCLKLFCTPVYFIIYLDNIMLFHDDVLNWLLPLKIWRKAAMLNLHRMKASTKRMLIGGYIILNGMLISSLQFCFIMLMPFHSCRFHLLQRWSHHLRLSM